MARLAAACCHRDVTEAPGSLETGCLGGEDAREHWQFVGEGKGNYIQAPDYDYVGDGCGSYAPQRVITYRGWKFRRGCLQAAGAVATLAILAGVATLVLWSPRSADAVQGDHLAAAVASNSISSSNSSNAPPQRPSAATPVTTVTSTIAPAAAYPSADAAAATAAGMPPPPTSDVGSIQATTNATQPLDTAAAMQVVSPQGVVTSAAPAIAVISATPVASGAAELDEQQELKMRQAVPLFNCANVEALTTEKTSYCCEQYGQLCDAFQRSSAADPTLTTGLTSSCAAFGCTDQYNAEWPCQCNPKCTIYSNCCDDQATQCPA